LNQPQTRQFVVGVETRADGKPNQAGDRRRRAPRQQWRRLFSVSMGGFFDMAANSIL